MQTRAPHHATHELFHAMQEQHVRIDAALTEMQNMVTGDDREAMRACWAKVEDAILAHLDLEEMHFLPLLAARDPRAASAVRGDHDAIRARVGEIGLELDLGTARADSLEALAAFLRRHARLEDRGLYALAEEALAPSLRRSVLERVRGALARRDRP